MDERELVLQAAAGDAAAFEQLVLKYQQPVYALALQMVCSPDDAQDLAQETFVKAWTGLETFRTDASFSAWLYRLAANTCRDFLRSQKRHPSLPLGVRMEDGTEELPFPDEAPLPEEQLIAAEERALLIAALGELAPEQQHLLALRAAKDLSYIELARELGLQEGTVKSRLGRAREALRKKMLQIEEKMGDSPSRKKKFKKNDDKVGTKSRFQRLKG